MTALPTPSADAIDALALAQLIARVEAATHGHRELDLAVARELNQPWGCTDNAPEKPGGEWWPSNISCGRYTTSLDAALALAARVAPGWSPCLRQDPRPQFDGLWHALFVKRGDTRKQVSTWGHTAPLAVVEAMLRALAALAETLG